MFQEDDLVSPRGTKAVAKVVSVARAPFLLLEWGWPGGPRWELPAGELIRVGRWQGGKAKYAESIRTEELST